MNCSNTFSFKAISSLFFFCALIACLGLQEAQAKSAAGVGDAGFQFDTDAKEKRKRSARKEGPVEEVIIPAEKHRSVLENRLYKGRRQQLSFNQELELITEDEVSSKVKRGQKSGKSTSANRLGVFERRIYKKLEKFQGQPNYTDVKIKLDEKFKNLKNLIGLHNSAAKKSEKKKLKKKIKKLLRSLKKNKDLASESLASPFFGSETLGRGEFKKFPEKFISDPVQEPEYVKHGLDANGLYASLGQISPPNVKSNATHCEYNPEDLQATNEVELTDDIRALAAELDYSPVKIYEYVLNNVVFEPYWGAKLKSTNVLLGGEGNSTDQASLLIALLRASNIPARYVQGFASFSKDERFSNWLGTYNTKAAVGIFSGSGISGFFSEADDQVAIEHVWVEACVPFNAYHGDVDANEGHLWVALDPSFNPGKIEKGLEHTLNVDVSEYISTVTTQMPSEKYLEQVLENTRLATPDASIEELGIVSSKPYKKVNKLPASLPYRVSSFRPWFGTQKAEISALPEAHRFKVGIRFEGSGELSVDTAELAASTLSLVYEGSNGSAQSVFDDIVSNGNFDALSAACSNGTVNLRPVLAKDGVRYWSGTTFNACNGISQSIMISHHVPEDFAGGAVSIDADFQFVWVDKAVLSIYVHHTSQEYINQLSEKLLTSIDSPVYQDESLYRFLHLAANKYFKNIVSDASDIARIDHRRITYSHVAAITSTYHNFDYVFDLPFGIRPGGVVINASIDGGTLSVETGEPDITPTAINSRLVEMLSGSANEHYIWQEMLDGEAISTVRGLQYANESGMQVLEISCAQHSDANARQSCANNHPDLALLQQNSDSSLNYDNETVANLRQRLADGYELTVPVSLLDFGGWLGYVYSGVQYDTDGSIKNATYTINRNAGGYYSPGYYFEPYTVLDQSGYADFNNFINTGDDLFSLGFQDTYDFAGSSLIDWYNPILNSSINSSYSYDTVYGGDPVNLVNGNMFHPEVDFTLPVPGGESIIFERNYNSGGIPQDGPIGFGWTHTFNARLIFIDNNLNDQADIADTDDVVSGVRWVTANGAERFIQILGGGASGVAIGSEFVIPEDFYFDVSREGDGTYLIEEKDGTKYRFSNVAGVEGDVARLTHIENRQGNELTLSYVGNHLQAVTDNLGRSISFIYGQDNDSDRIVKIVDWSGREYHYEYDSAGDLVAYKSPLAVDGKSNPITYSYYSENDGDYKAHRMKIFTDANGNPLTYEYYVDGRVFRHTNGQGEQFSFYYNKFHRETSVVDPRGNKKVYQFNRSGEPVREEDELGNVSLFEYNPDNQHQRTVEGNVLGHKTQYQYDANGNVTVMTLPDDSTVEYSFYNEFNFPGKVKDARGIYTLYQYDASGNLKEQIVLRAGVGALLDPTAYQPNDSDIVAWHSRTYDNYGNLSTLMQVRDYAAKVGPTIELDYNDTKNNIQGVNLVGITYRGDLDGDGTIGSDEFYTVTQEYDALGRVVKGVNKNRYPVEYKYNANNQLIQSTDAIGRLRDFIYDSNNNLVGESLTGFDDGLLKQLDFFTAKYDANNKLLEVANAAGASVAYQYDENGNLLVKRDADGYEQSYEYDAKNRAFKTRNELGNTSQTHFDSLGRIVKSIDPNGNGIRHEYYGAEGNGRLKTRYDALERRTDFEYDAAGNVTKVIDNAGNSTSTEYDELNRPIRIVGPIIKNELDQDVRPVTRYSYTNLGQVQQVSAGHTDTAASQAAEQLSVQASYLFDDFGRQLRETDALGHATYYTYDRHNNVLTRTDANQQTTTYEYAYGGLLEKMVDHEGNEVTYTYDAMGNPLTISSNLVAYAYEYDAAHRVSRVTDNRANKQISYHYTRGGRLRQLQHDQGLKVDYHYDAVGRLNGVQASNGHVVEFRRDAGGRVVERVTNLGKINTGYEYNADNSLKLQREHFNGSFYEVRAHYFSYDDLGNLDSVNEVIDPDAVFGNNDHIIWRQTYQYDALQRLTQNSMERTDHTATGEVNTQVTNVNDYSYDVLGNLRERKVDGSSQFYLYDAGQQLQEIRQGSIQGSLVAEFDYDNNGNMIQKITGGTTLDLAYDALNRLKQANKTGQPQELYQYDPVGRRIQKQVGSDKTLYHYHGQQIAGEYQNDWNSTPAQYSYGPGIDMPLMRSEGSNVTNYHHNWLNSVEVASDGQGNITGWQKFDDWGNTLESGGSVPRYGYTGREPDATGLMYYRARYYDPSIARFTQRDPLGFVDGINRYAYAMNNPLRYNDPMGTSVNSVRDGLSQSDVRLDLSVNQSDYQMESFGEFFTERVMNGGVRDDIYSYAGGLLDGMSFGYTKMARNALGLNEYVDENSMAFGVGDNVSLVQIGGVLKGGLKGGIKIWNARSWRQNSITSRRTRARRIREGADEMKEAGRQEVLGQGLTAWNDILINVIW
jgi:RHS repeat-associated protein